MERMPAMLEVVSRNSVKLLVSDANGSVSPSLTEDATMRRLSVDLELDMPDPLEGLFVGSFGPHGPEALELRRGEWEGQEAVFARKVVGDRNVPAGELSFRAKVGRDQRLNPRQAYPDELGVVARYPGEGRVARPGFRGQRWVPGEFLQLDGRGGKLTGDAELGFVWAVPGERKFLILFNRLVLG